MKFKIYLLFTFVCTVLIETVFAQSKWEPKVSYSHRAYTIRDGLCQMQVSSLYQDRKGYLWSGTKAGVSRFDGKFFKNYSRKKLKIVGDLRKISEDAKGNILFFHKTGVSKLVNDKVVFYPYQFKNNYYTDLGRKKNIVKCVQKEKIKLVSFVDSVFFDIPLPNKIKNRDLYSISIDKFSKDKIWILTKTQILFFDIKNDDILEEYPNDFNITKLICSRDNKLYGISNSGFYYFDRGKSVFLKEYDYIFRDNVPSVIASPNDNSLILVCENSSILQYKSKTLKKIIDNLNIINCLLFDDEGNLWIGTEEGLVNLFHLDFINYTFLKSKKDYVWNILEDKNGHMWFSSYNNGIWAYKNNKVTDYTNKVGDKYSFYMGGLKYNDTLYFPTNNTILKYDGDKFKVSKKMPNMAYLCSCLLKDSTILFGGVDGVASLGNDKKYRWDRKTLNIATCVTLKQNNKGDIIAGSRLGISVIKKDTICHYKTHSAVSSAKDFKGNIWLAEEKLSLYKDDSIQMIYDFKDEFLVDLKFIKPHYLLVGGKCNIYVVNLLEYYEKGKFSFFKYGKDNGFLGIECGQNSMFQDSKGMMWLTTSDRVIKFDPIDLFEKKRKPPRPILQVLSSEGLADFSRDITNEQFIELPYEYNNIRFVFSAISFEYSEDVLFSYKLEGVNSDWSTLSPSREVSFYDLKSGKFKFFLIANGGDFHSNSDILSFEFSIQTPFFRSWWFYMIALFCFILIVLGVHKYYKSKAIKKELDRQQQIYEITNLQLANIKSQLNPHFIFNLMNHFGVAIMKGRGEESYDYFVQLSKLIRETLTDAEKPLKTLSEEFDFVNRYLRLQEYRLGNRFDFIFELDDGIDKKMLIPKMCLQILVENAIQYGYQDSNSVNVITVFGYVNPQGIIIGVKDSGNGFSLQKSQEGNGKGLSNLRKILKIYNNYNEDSTELYIKSTGQGSTVSIFIPKFYNFVFSKKKNDE